MVVDRLSDRVHYWMTFNEPQLFVGGGYLWGFHAPFEKNEETTMLQITRNVLLAHGKAVSIIRTYGKISAKVGMSPTGSVFIPESESKEDVEKAREKSFFAQPQLAGFGNTWWADPIFLGHFPKEVESAFQEKNLALNEEEWKLVAQPLDFYGFNVYQGDVSYPIPEDGYDELSYQGCPKTMQGWKVTPEVLYWSARFLYERYQKPLLITENGMSGMDWMALDGKVHDPQRIDFMKRYLLQLERAMDEGIPVLGYQYWSLIDNFEWCEGYDKRFGLIYVDYHNEKRTLKDSAYWYREVIAENGKNLHQ